MSTVGKISPSLEDYVEIIFCLTSEKGIARVKDVAEKKSVSKASVNNALKRLVAEDLIYHENYGYITLTGKGLQLAKKLHKRHGVLKKFLSDILNVGPKIAETDACTIEHHVHKETIDALIKFVDSKKILTLNEIKPGSRCRIKKIKATGTMKERLLEMGLHTGEIIKVERVAPLGDPIGIKIKRYSLSIRKQDAALIEVEEIRT